MLNKIKSMKRPPVRVIVGLVVLTIIAVAVITIPAGRNGGLELIAEEPLATPIPLTPPPTPTPPPIPTPEPILSPPPGMAINPVTGLYISEQTALRRPFAVVYNNESRAMPQSGLFDADIIYEVLAEGVTTRLVAIFSDFDASVIGPVRSTRYYFNYLAQDHNAVLVHHGGSPLAYNAIRSRGLAHIDGMQFDGTVFWRDAWRRQNRGLEHSSMTSSENLLSHAEGRFTMEMAAPNAAMFDFFDEPTNPAPENIANTVTITFAGSNRNIFTFNEHTGLYYKYFFGNPHMDEYTDRQIAVANVIVQITGIRHIPGDTDGRRNVDLIGEGRGYLITSGGYVPITWAKADAASPTRWYDTDGNRLTINRGQTWVNIVNTQPEFEQ